MKEKGKKRLKYSAIIIGTIIVLLYFVLSLIESSEKVIAVLILLPVLVWPYVAYKYTRQAAVMSFVIAAVAVIWFAIDFLLIRTHQQLWHIPLFIVIAPLPAVVLGWMLLVSTK